LQWELLLGKRSGPSVGLKALDVESRYDPNVLTVISIPTYHDRQVRMNAVTTENGIWNRGGCGHRKRSARMNSPKAMTGGRKNRV